jgi:hypothetical protein
VWAQFGKDRAVLFTGVVPISSLRLERVCADN